MSKGFLHYPLKIGAILACAQLRGHVILEDMLRFIPVDPSWNSSASRLNLSVLINQMLMETLWVKRQKSFNFCPVRDPPNWLGESS